jgi:23S rRNA (cytidine1920-2'-O)/16S rRNA (cytidine1409-2'-O)-methyltransferase
MSPRQQAGDKDRLDVLLFKSNKAPSREIARGLILAGRVFVAGRLVDKPGTRVDAGSAIEIRGEIDPYASRGGKKLEAAIDHFRPNVEEAIAIDVGASTGGFTDCLLRYGASKVYAVDVGYGQLAWRLRQDPRVIVIERTNFRYFDPARLDEKPAVATVDVSFISLSLIVPVLAGVLTETAEIVALVKPQFEAGRDKVGKGGVVRDPAVHKEVIEAVAGYFRDAGFVPHEPIESPLIGPAGNKEFLLYATRNS